MITKLPCEECLLLPVCMNKEVIKCEIVLKALEHYMNEPYSNTAWSYMSKLIKKTLRGNWGLEAIITNGNTRINSVRKYESTNKVFKEEETNELFQRA